MILLVSLLLVAQPGNVTTNVRWDSTDVLIEDSLGSYVDFAADYNYTTGDIYVACIAASGTYCGPDDWGLLLFRSTDHGESWDLLYSLSESASLTEGKEIDIVVTRNDTVYIVYTYDDLFVGNDKLCLIKIYDNGEEWFAESTTGSFFLAASEFSTPKLIRDDFDDFYLYMAYWNPRPGSDNALILRSMDRGYNWDTIAVGHADEYQDADITVADSTVYSIWTWQGGELQIMELAYWKDRGDDLEGAYLLSYDTTSHTEIIYPRIGATTTIPDNGQLIYVFYSQENLDYGNHDLLYLYSQNGGVSWNSAPDTLAEGSSSPVLCDLRGYQVDPNEYMDITYCFTSTVPYPSYKNFFRWSYEGDPTNWHDTTFVSEGLQSSVPELIYSPGGGAPGGGVVYNDFFGNLWFDAPWYSGIAEGEEREGEIKSRIVLSPGSVEVISSGAVVYDVMGRKIKVLDSNIWDLTDEKGRKVDGGIYFVVKNETGDREKLILIK
jgi:hypothetical protein